MTKDPTSPSELRRVDTNLIGFAFVAVGLALLNLVWHNHVTATLAAGTYGLSGLYFFYLRVRWSTIPLWIRVLSALGCLFIQVILLWVLPRILRLW